jgi:hypothetical protein
MSWKERYEPELILEGTTSAAIEFAEYFRFEEDEFTETRHRIREIEITKDYVNYLRSFFVNNSVERIVIPVMNNSNRIVLGEGAYSARRLPPEWSNEEI